MRTAHELALREQALRLQALRQQLEREEAARAQFQREQAMRERANATRVALEQSIRDRATPDRSTADRLATDRLAADRLAADRLSTSRPTASRDADDGRAAALKPVKVSGSSEAGLGTRGLRSRAMSLDDLLELPLSSIRRLLNGQAISTALVLALVHGLLNSTAALAFGDSIPARGLQVLATLGLTVLFLHPLLRISAADSVTPWHVDADEQVASGTALGRLAMCAVVGTVLFTPLLIAMPDVVEHGLRLGEGLHPDQRWRSIAHFTAFAAIVPLILMPLSLLVVRAATERAPLSMLFRGLMSRPMLANMAWLCATTALAASVCFAAWWLGGRLVTLPALHPLVLTFAIPFALSCAGIGLLLALMDATLAPETLGSAGAAASHASGTARASAAPSAGKARDEGSLADLLKGDERGSVDAERGVKGWGNRLLRTRKDTPNAAVDNGDDFPATISMMTPEQLEDPLMPMAVPTAWPIARKAEECWHRHEFLRTHSDPRAARSMLANARRYLGAVIASRQPSDALQIWTDCHQRDPAFEPGEADRLGLAMAALATQRPAVALSVLNNFEERFPKSTRRHAALMLMVECCQRQNDRAGANRLRERAARLQDEERRNREARGAVGVQDEQDPLAAAMKPR